MHHLLNLSLGELILAHDLSLKFGLAVPQSKSKTLIVGQRYRACHGEQNEAQHRGEMASSDPGIYRAFQFSHQGRCADLLSHSAAFCDDLNTVRRNE